MKLFLDCEFTGLRQNTALISIGLVSEDGRTFYAEVCGFDQEGVDTWIIENVIANLRFGNNRSVPTLDLEHYDMCGWQTELREKLYEWLAQFDQVEIWSDCLAYDWVLFCQIFSGAFEIPKHIYYIPFDICTVFKLKGIDPDVNREEYAGLDGKKHNALHDARVIKACYEKAMQPVVAGKGEKAVTAY